MKVGTKVKARSSLKSLKVGEGDTGVIIGISDDNSIINVELDKEQTVVTSVDVFWTEIKTEEEPVKPQQTNRVASKLDMDGIGVKVGTEGTIEEQIQDPETNQPMIAVRLDTTGELVKTFASYWEPLTEQVNLINPNQPKIKKPFVKKNDTPTYQPEYQTHQIPQHGMPQQFVPMQPPPMAQFQTPMQLWAKPMQNFPNPFFQMKVENFDDPELYKNAAHAPQSSSSLTNTFIYLNNNGEFMTYMGGPLRKNEIPPELLHTPRQWMRTNQFAQLVSVNNIPYQIVKSENVNQYTGNQVGALPVPLDEEFLSSTRNTLIANISRLEKEIMEQTDTLNTLRNNLIAVTSIQHKLGVVPNFQTRNY